MKTNQFKDATPWQSLYRICATAALVLLAYCLATLVIMALTGGQPGTVEETFAMLRENRLLGLLRLDLLTALVMPLYYVLFLGFLIALWRVERVYAMLAALLIFTGVTIFLSMPSVFSYLFLSDRYALAAGEAQRQQLLAAGEAILAADSWHGTGAVVSGLMVQSGAVLISFVMLRGNVFRKATATAGLVTHSLDLAHILVAFLAPQLSVILMSIAGLLYLLWFPMIAIDFWKMGKERQASPQAMPVPVG